MAEAFLGEIRMFGFNFNPVGWFLCQGQTLPISQYSALFSLLGTYYGGNGTTNFQIPDFQGRVPLAWGSGAGLSPYVIGQKGGAQNESLTIANMPAHSHTYAPLANSGAATASRPGGGFMANNGNSLYAGSNDGTAMGGQTTAAAGSSVAFPILQPFLAVTFAIAWQGIFPSRN